MSQMPMPEFDLLIRGNIVLPDTVLTDAFVAVSHGTIAVVDIGLPPKAAQVIDCRGQWVLPGAIDAHVHSGSQAGREGMAIATRAAAAGGVTTIADMPYDDPGPVTCAERLRRKVESVQRSAHVDVALYGTIAKAGGVAELPGLVRAGACALKLSTYETHAQRFPRIAPLDMLAAFRVATAAGLVCVVHSEDQEMVERLLAEVQAEGCSGPGAHGRSRPPISESLAIAQVYELAAAAGGRVRVAHCSIGRGVELCELYRQQGVPVSIETCAHYLTFSEDDLDRLGALGKVNPPLRSREEVERLWAHLTAGHIDLVASDHIAWGLERKSRPGFLENASGFPGLESLLPAFYTGCLQHALPIAAVARYLSEGPARQLGIYPRKGALLPGSDADITILEEGRFIFDAASTQTVAEWSPYHGLELAGRPRATFVRGRQVWDGSRVLVQPGFGRFVRPHTAPVL